MDEPSPRFGIIGLEFEILMVGAGGLGLFLGVEALRKTLAPPSRIRLNFQRAPESGFGLFSLTLLKGRPTQVIDGGDVVGIQM